MTFEEWSRQFSSDVDMPRVATPPTPLVGPVGIPYTSKLVPSPTAKSDRSSSRLRVPRGDDYSSTDSKDDFVFRHRGSYSADNDAATRGKRLNSMQKFHTTGETIVIFDWDDTLFPTTWATEVLDSQYLEEAVVDEFMQLSLRECSLSALAILRFAASVAGIVVIVTLAREGWLESLIARFAPELDGEL